MDPELKKQIEEMYALTKENNHMLRSIRRDQWLGFLGRVIVWIIVLTLPLYIYQQYLDPIITKFTSSSGTTSTSMFDVPTSAEVQKLINSYKTGK